MLFEFVIEFDNEYDVFPDKVRLEPSVIVVIDVPEYPFIVPEYPVLTAVPVVANKLLCVCAIIL